MLRRLLINEKPSFASIGYIHQQLSRVKLGTANRHSQFHCPNSKISKVGRMLSFLIFFLLLLYPLGRSA